MLGISPSYPNRASDVILPDANIFISSGDSIGYRMDSDYGGDFEKFFTMDIVKKEIGEDIENENGDMDRYHTKHVIKIKKKYLSLSSIAKNEREKKIIAMYDDISNSIDPIICQQKLKLSIVKKNETRYPYKMNRNSDSDLSDNKILTDASLLADDKTVTIFLLTYDWDFIAFANIIHKRFDVHILSAYKYFTEDNNGVVNKIVKMKQKELLQFYDVIDKKGNARIYGKRPIDMMND